MKKWVCPVCGYVYEGEEPPAFCPQCKVPGSKFIEQKAEMSWAAEHVVGVGKQFGADVPEEVKKEIIAGFGDRPAVLVMVIDNQTVGFGCRLEFAVVVGVASAAILNAVNVVPVVNHLMQKGGGNVFNGPWNSKGGRCEILRLPHYKREGNPCHCGEDGEG